MRKRDHPGTIRRKIERRSLPAEPPEHMRLAWHMVVAKAMAGGDVTKDIQFLRLAEKEWLKSHDSSNP